jgi:hypothetical protein
MVLKAKIPALFELGLAVWLKRSPIRFQYYRPVILSPIAPNTLPPYPSKSKSLGGGGYSPAGSRDDGVGARLVRRPLMVGPPGGAAGSRALAAAVARGPRPHGRRVPPMAIQRAGAAASAPAAPVARPLRRHLPQPPRRRGPPPARRRRRRKSGLHGKHTLPSARRRRHVLADDPFPREDDPSPRAIGPPSEKADGPEGCPVR